MSPEELAAWTRASRATRGLPTPIEDQTVLARLVLLSDEEHDGGGSTASRRRPSKAPSPKTRPAAGKVEGADAEG